MAETLRIEIPIETIDKTEPELSNLIKKVRKLGDEADKTAQKTKKSSEYVSQYDKQIQKTEKRLAKWAKEKYEILLEAKEKVTPVLSMLGNGVRGLAGKTWGITLRAADFATAPIKGVINLLKNPLLQAGAILGVSIGLKDTVDTYKDFEAAMSQVQSISGATGAEVAKLTGKAKEMGATTKFTAAESAEAFNYMAMAGWKTGDMLEGIEGILNLAAASGEGLATTSDIVTDALTAFNMKASEAGHFSDVLAKAASSANTTVSGMGETFKYAGSMAGALGYSIEDVALMAGLMANTGIKGTMAGTSLNAIFTRLSTNAGGAADAIAGLGINFFDSEGNAWELSEVMGELREATASMTAEQKSCIANNIAGTEAQKGLLAILNASEEDYNKLADAINNADGAAAGMSETMLDNLHGSITLLQSAVDGVKLSFGERLAPYVRDIAEWLAAQMPIVEQGINEFMDWVETKVDRMQRKFSEVAGTKEWQDAGFFGKAKIAWDEFIAEPFAEWWASTGKAKFAGFAQDIGGGIGTGLKIGIMTLLGINLTETLDEGASIGASFAKGFAEGFDFDAVSGKLWQGFKNLFSSAGKLLPGGEVPGLDSIVSALILKKMAGPAIGLGKGAVGAGKGIAGAWPYVSRMLGSFSVADELAGVGAAGGSGLLGLLGNAGMALGSGATTSAGLVLAGGASIAGGVAGGAALVSGVKDLHHGYKSEDKAEKDAYIDSGLYKAGGVASGAIIGATLGTVIPGLGTAVGALIGAGAGGIAGWVKGNKIKEEYQKNVEAMQEEAERAQKVFEATGFAVGDAVFETKALNDAINDTGTSAEQLGAMFREAVGDNLESHFGKIKLSLAEIKEAASGIAFGGQAQAFEGYNEAIAASSSQLNKLKGGLQDISKMDWRAALGVSLSEKGKEDYKAAIDSLVADAGSYIESKHYEATLAVDLLVGSEKSGSLFGGMNAMYMRFQSQIGQAGEELRRAASEALSDGVISTEDVIRINIGGIEYEMDEAAAITKLQDQITEITDKVSNAQSEAKLESIKIRYGGAGLDSSTFARMQEEIAANAQEISADYDSALEVSLTSLNLQLAEGAIDEKQYDEMLMKIKTGYNARIDELEVRIESFQLEAIADAYGRELDGILPDIEGDTSEKLKEAMGRALKARPDPATWTREEISEWFGLESLGAETQEAIAGLLRQTASTIPRGMAEALSGADYSLVSEAMREGLDSSLAASSMALLPLNPGVASRVCMELAAADYGGSGAAVAGGVGTAISEADMAQINEGVESIYRGTKTQVDSVFAQPITTSAKVNVDLDWNIVNPRPSVDLGWGNAFSGSTLPSAGIKRNASGGFVSGRQLSWLAEEGYGEFVIPTNPSRRARALELYEQAGNALGVSAHAAGGYVGSMDPARAYSGGAADAIGSEATREYVPAQEKPDVRPIIQVEVNLSPEFVMQSSGGQDEEGIVGIVIKHMKEIADELGGEIAGKLEEVFSNMPLKEA